MAGVPLRLPAYKIDSGRQPMKCRFTLILLTLILISSGISQAGLPSGTQIILSATADYTNHLNLPCTAQSPLLVMTVKPSIGARIEWRMPDEKLETGKIIYIPVKITNIGNTSDVFDLSVASLSSWEASIIIDNGRGGFEQGSGQKAITEIALSGGQVYSCMISVTIPGDATKGDTLTTKAISRANALLGSASEQIFLDKPVATASPLTLSAAPETAVEGQTVSILGSLDPDIQESVTLTVTDPEANVSTYTCNPATDGSFKVDIVAGKPGYYTVDGKVVATATRAEKTAHTKFTVTNKTKSAIELSANTTTPAVDDELTISGALTPPAVADIAVNYQTPSGVIKDIAAKTDNSGNFSCTFSVVEDGVWSVSAEYKGSETVAAANKQIFVEAHQATQSTAHSISFDTAPSLSASKVASAETITCSASATDSVGDTVNYLWTDNSAGGTFTPSAAIASPTYAAPTNKSDTDLSVKLSCTAKCSTDASVVVSGTAELTVLSASSAPPTVLSVTPQPGANQAEIAEDIVIKFSKKMNMTLARQALTFKPPIDVTAYNWDEDSTILTVKHNALNANISYDCSISTVAQDASGVALARDYKWSFTTVPTFRFDVAEIGANPSAVFATPKLIMNDPQQPSYVSVKIGIPAGLNVNNVVDSSGNLDCVKSGADVGSLQSSWDEKSREITIGANVVNPSASVEIVKAIRLASTASSGTYVLKAQGSDVLTVNVRTLMPGDFTGDGCVNMSDASLFLQEWVRWQQERRPSYDIDIDEKFDLAPHTENYWPSWTIIGDRLIDEKDSKAFTDCWAAGHMPAMPTSQRTYLNSSRCEYVITKSDIVTMQVMVSKTINDIFEAIVAIPTGVQFDSTIASSGNLINVAKGQGAGSLFFSEYDPKTRTVRIAGVTTGRTPFNVATIVLTR